MGEFYRRARGAVERCNGVGKTTVLEYHLAIAPATDAVGVGRTDIVGGQRRRSDELLAGGDEQFADALVRCLVRGRFRCNIYGWLRLRRYKVRFYLHRALNHRAQIGSASCREGGVSTW